MPDPPRPKAPGTGVPLPPPAARPKQTKFTTLPSALPVRPERTIVATVAPPAKRSAPMPELDEETEIRQPSRQDDRSEATETPIGPVGQRRERLPERQREPRSMSPAPWDPRASSPELKREVERGGDRLVKPPESTPSLPPAPSQGDVDVRVGDVRVRVGSSVTRKLLPWLAPLLLSAVGTAVGYAKGYFEGLAAAGRRVAAVEEAVRLNAEGDARHEKKTSLELNRAFVVLDDHDERIPKIENRLSKVEQQTPRVEGLRPR